MIGRCFQLNEVKRSLNSIVGDVSKDKEDIKQSIRMHTQKPKRKLSFPVLATAIISAAIFFFAFTVFTGEQSNTNEKEYEVNEHLYDIQLKTSVKQNEHKTEDELKYDVLWQMFLIDSVIEYAKSHGYEEDKQAIEKLTVMAEEKFFENSTEDEKLTIEQSQLSNFGISFSEYFHTINKHTIQYREAFNWLKNHPPIDSKTHRAVVDSFLQKNDDVISDFIKTKNIPTSNLPSTFREYEGIVATIANNEITVVMGLERKELEKMTIDEIINAGYDVARFSISKKNNQIEPYMEINVTFDPLSYPILQTDGIFHYQTVIEWE